MLSWGSQYDGLTVPSMRIETAPATVVLCATYSLVTPVFTASERTSLSAKCPNRTHRHLQELESEVKVTDLGFPGFPFSGSL